MDEKRVTRRAERQRVNERKAQRYVAGHWTWVSEPRGGEE